MRVTYKFLTSVKGALRMFAATARLAWDLIETSEGVHVSLSGHHWSEGSGPFTDEAALHRYIRGVLLRRKVIWS